MGESVKLFERQILRIESNRDGLMHTSHATQKDRTNAYGRIPITTKYAGTCGAVKLGKVCGNEIKKGTRAYWEPNSGTLECRDCWS